MGLGPLLALGGTQSVQQGRLGRMSALFERPKRGGAYNALEAD